MFIVGRVDIPFCFEITRCLFRFIVRVVLTIVVSFVFTFDVAGVAFLYDLMFLILFDVFDADATLRFDVNVDVIVVAASGCTDAGGTANLLSLFFLSKSSLCVTYSCTQYALLQAIGCKRIADNSSDQMNCSMYWQHFWAYIYPHIALMGNFCQMTMGNQGVLDEPLWQQDVHLR